MEKQIIITITKTTAGLLSMFGLAPKKKLDVFRISDTSLFYFSTLGDVGEIKSDFIELIEYGHFETSNIIKIKLTKEFDLKSKLTKFRQKVSEVYKKKTGAEILIFPQDTDWDLLELSKLLKDKLNK